MLEVAQNKVRAHAKRLETARNLLLESGAQNKE